MMTQISSCHFHSSKPEMGKRFSRRVALTIQELAEDRIEHSRIRRGPMRKIL